MKKQVLAYRREIIEFSSTKKLYSINNHNHHHNSKSEGRPVPRLDLSKLHRESEDGKGHDDGDESCASIRHAIDDGDGKNVTYQ